jgi:EKC/KEOPS complex subunit CGI121/TPRKB
VTGSFDARPRATNKDKLLKMQTFTYPYLPDELSLVNLWLFREVQNAAQLRTRLQQASLMEGSEGEVEREKLNFGFLDASKVGA